MSEKKKTTYRYTQETELLINKGMEQYRHISPTGILTFNALLDHCLLLAVVKYPSEIQEYEANLRHLIEEVNTCKNKIARYQRVIRSVQNHATRARQIKAEIQELINEE
ncbi:MAG: hypothetical protein JXR50_06320 [Prolixibacteraceae bacterium]|nr:hypothetical protein [Prolixibacteraceae bacterium]